MSDAPIETGASAAQAERTASTPAVAAPSFKLSRTTLCLLALSLFAILLSASMWFKLRGIQEALARQSTDATAAALEARALARSAQDTVQDVLGKQALIESRLSEVAMQRSQLDEIMQSLSRSRDENLLVDVDSAIRLAQQQANLTGSIEPLLAALRSAEQRVSRAAQPRLSPLRRALAKDIDRVKAANVADTPSLLIKLDQVVRLADDMPLANAVATSGRRATPATQPTRPMNADAGNEAGFLHILPNWLIALWDAVRSEALTLVRVGRIDAPVAALLTPEQGFFARENFKLKLLNARLALLSSQLEVTRGDLAAATQLSALYFDASARSVQQANAVMAQIRAQLHNAQQPRIDDTLTALTSLAALTTQSK